MVKLHLQGRLLCLSAIRAGLCRIGALSLSCQGIHIATVRGDKHDSGGNGLGEAQLRYRHCNPGSPVVAWLPLPTTPLHQPDGCRFLDATGLRQFGIGHPSAVIPVIAPAVAPDRHVITPVSLCLSVPGGSSPLQRAVVKGGARLGTYLHQALCEANWSCCAILAALPPLPGQAGRGKGPALSWRVGAGGAHRATAQQSDAHQARTERNLSGPASVVALLRHTGTAETVRFRRGVLLAYAGRRKGRLPRPVCFLVSPLLGPGWRLGVEGSECPSSQRYSAAAARSGGQRRRRLALGPDPRAATRSRFLAASMTSTGRTHLLPAASTGHFCCEGWAELSTGGRLSTAEKFKFFLSSI